MTAGRTGRGPHLGLASGRRFHPLDPRASDFKWSDVADGVCRIPRYTGQLPRIARHETYVVGQHLCLAVYLARIHGEPHDVQKAIFGHDKTEGIWGFLDVCNPVKRIPDVADVLLPIERGIDVVMAARLGLPADAFSWGAVKRYDLAMLAWENRDLRGEMFVAELDLPSEVWALVPQETLRPWTIGETRERFDALLAELGLFDEEDRRHEP